MPEATARSFNDVAGALMETQTLEEIECIPFPPALENRHQHFTEANIISLRHAGWNESFTSLEDGIRRPNIGRLLRPVTRTAGELVTIG
jgi:ADP-L-glycero-D-manno-heptose 6-epimerase